LIGAAAPRMGFVYPTEPVSVKPDSSGEFTVVLADTTVMLGDAFYRLQIRWLGAQAGAAVMDFPEWKIRPGGSNAPISDVIDSGAATNAKFWWVGLSQPPSKKYLWLHTNPDDPDDSRNTGDVREWR